MKNLREHLTFDQAQIVLENANEGKDLYMKGICIQGDVRNANQRVYPVNEIGRAVKTLNDQISGGYSVLGEVDHPEGLNINLDRVSHMISEMWMDDANGYGKLKILPTPMGNLVKTMLESARWPLFLPPIHHALISANLAREARPESVEDVKPERVVCDGMAASIADALHDPSSLLRRSDAVASNSILNPRREGAT